MTSMKKYTTLALMLACMACSEEKANDSTLTKLKIKDLEHEETIEFSELFSDERLVCLETNDNGLIGEDIQGIRLINDKIYIFDWSKILIFDKDGHYLNNIDKRGQGPEEYTNIFDFEVNSNGDIIVLPGSKKLMFYDADGHFKRSIDLKLNASSLQLINDNEALLYHDVVTNLADDTLKTVVTKLNFTTGESITCKTGGMGGIRDFLVVVGGSKFKKSTSNSNVYLSDTMCDTLFLLQDDKMVPYIYFDYDGKNFPFSKYGSENIGEYIENINQGTWPNGTALFFSETEDQYMYTYRHKDTPHFVCYPKSGTNIRNFSNVKDSKYLFGMDSLAYNGIHSNNDFVIISLQPYAIEDYAQNNLTNRQKEELMKRINYTGDDQNPVLLIAKIK